MLSEEPVGSQDGRVIAAADIVGSGWASGVGSRAEAFISALAALAALALRAALVAGERGRQVFSGASGASGASGVVRQDASTKSRTKSFATIRMDMEGSGISDEKRAFARRS